MTSIARTKLFNGGMVDDKNYDVSAKGLRLRERLAPICLSYIFLSMQYDADRAAARGNHPGGRFVGSKFQAE